MAKPLKKGRTLALTVRELLESPRMKIAVAKYASGDNSFMKAVLTELGMEAENVGKHSVIRAWKLNKHLNDSELYPILKRVGTINADDRDRVDDVSYMPKKDTNEMNTYNIWWNLTKAEVAYWLAEELNPQITEEEKAALLDEVLVQFGLR